MRRPGAALLVLAIAALGGAACGDVEASGGGIADSAEKVQPLEVGAVAPSVSLRDVDGNAVELDAVRGDGAVALVFYRGGW